MEGVGDEFFAAHGLPGASGGGVEQGAEVEGGVGERGGAESGDFGGVAVHEVGGEGVAEDDDAEGVAEEVGLDGEFAAVSGGAAAVAVVEGDEVVGAAERGGAQGRAREVGGGREEVEEEGGRQEALEAGWGGEEGGGGRQALVEVVEEVEELEAFVAGWEVIPVGELGGEGEVEFGAIGFEYPSFLHV